MPHRLRTNPEAPPATGITIVADTNRFLLPLMGEVDAARFCAQQKIVRRVGWGDALDVSAARCHMFAQSIRNQGKSMSAHRAGTSAVAEGATIAATLDTLTRAFADAGIDTPRLDARLLLCAATTLSAEHLVLDPDRTLAAVEAARLSDFAAQRLAREPVSRILGRRDFYGRTYKVTPATLDPRPETETVVDLALSLIAHDTRTRMNTGMSTRILDIGTGSGALLLTLLAELPGATGIGTDISAEALAVARENAGALGLAGRAGWLHTSLYEGIAETFDLIVSNPPYIPAGDGPGLDPEVRLYDPAMALFSGPDGLDAIRAIVAGAARMCRPGGWCVVEFGAGQWPEVEKIMENQGIAVTPGDRLRIGADLSGHHRCVAWQPHS